MADTMSNWQLPKCGLPRASGLARKNEAPASAVEDGGSSSRDRPWRLPRLARGLPPQISDCRQHRVLESQAPRGSELSIISILFRIPDLYLKKEGAELMEMRLFRSRKNNVGWQPNNSRFHS